MKKHSHIAATILLMSALQAAACAGNLSQNPQSAIDSSGSATGVAAIPFHALSPAAYTTKVKNLLTGLPATAAEIEQVKTNPGTIKSLIAQWQKAPTYAPKMVHFLSNAFQQSDVTAADFVDQGMRIDNRTLESTHAALLLKNLREQVAHTVLLNDAAGRPFSDAITSSRYAMTPPLAAYYAYVDQLNIDDQGNRGPGPQGDFAATIDAFTAADFDNWRMVTIRKPNAGEATSLFTDTAATRTATTLVLKTPRVGFFTTPSFFAGYQTNLSNQARVTTNQMMIVALGHAIDGTNVSIPPDLAAIDSAHAAPNTPCYGCHVNLDPMRQFFRQAYSIHFSVQTDPNLTSQPGAFGFDGVTLMGTHGIADLAKVVGTHPRLASAWVQKLCTYADDGPCITTDAEFTRVVDAFTSSNQSFSTLVQELFSSPLVTYASITATGAANQAFPVTKRDHLCPELSARLGLNDACFQDPTTPVTKVTSTVLINTSILPSNGYSRGQVLPVLANDPSLSFRAGLENVCAAMATLVVDTGAANAFSSTDPAGSITKMVHDFMGIQAPDDSTPIQLLTDHFNSAMSMGSVKATDAMKSTFIVACLSPSIAGIGQ